MNRSSTPCVRYHVLLYVIVAATRQLVAYDRERVVKVRVNVRGFGDREARAAAVALAKRAVRELRRSA